MHDAASPDAVRVLLLQARRPDDPMREHERGCFVRASGLDSDDLQCINLVDTVPTISDLVRFDALMVGGAGHFSLTDRAEDFYEPVSRLLRTVVDEGFPTFASCFGYQLLVHALGGVVASDPAGSEVGSFRLRLTDAGRRDELFGSLPDEFTAQLGHTDRAVEMPAAIPNLASSERSPFQALRIPDRPIWATQFHPELDQETNRDRYLAYIERYDPQRRGEESSGFTSLPSVEASTLLPRFLQIIRG